MSTIATTIVAVPATKLAQVMALVAWHAELKDAAYGVMSPRDVLQEILNFKILARSSALPEFLVDLKRLADEKIEKNKKRPGSEIFAAAGVLWIIDYEIRRVLAS